MRSVAPVPDPPPVLVAQAVRAPGDLPGELLARVVPFAEGAAAEPAAARSAGLLLEVERWARRAEACCAGFEAARFSEHCLLTAWLAEALGEELQDWMALSGETLFTAGLLHDVGRLVLVERYPAEYVRVLAEARSELPLHALEVAAFGCTHAQVSALVVEEWGLGTELCGALGSHHGPRREVEATPLASAVAFADRVAKRVQEGAAADPLELETEPACTFWGVGSGAIDEIEARAILGLERLRRRPAGDGP